jgi:RecG-like helicase
VRVAKKKGLAGAVRRLATPVEELDRENLRDYCSTLGVTPMTDLQPRERVRLGGEVRSVRVVPRAGAPALEVTVNDGQGSATAVFLGRSNIAGITPGRRMVIEGVAGKYGNRYLIFNPTYTLLP